MNIVENAMLMNLQLGSWTAFKLDRKASAKTADDHHVVDGKSVRVNKRIIAEEAIKEVETARNAVRSHFYLKTLPWGDNGDRLLPRLSFMPFMDAHTPLEEAFYERVRIFCSNYAMERDKAKFNLVDMFDINDYPHPDDVRRKFYCRVDISPIATPDDFRVKLNDDALDTVRRQIEEKTIERIAGAQADVWARIEKCVTNMAERMNGQLEEVPEGGKRKPLHQSTFDNAIELVNSLRALNITGDPNVNAIGKRMHALLRQHNDAEVLKGDATACSAIKDALDEMIEEMAGFSRGMATV